MIENPNAKPDSEQPELEFVAETPLIRTSKVLFGTKTAYDITIRTFDPNALALGGLKADGLVTVKVKPKYEAKRANAKKDFK